ncbi:MAG: diaminopimelate decarboxylase, partial [Bacteroidales bacterium]|nr:diaminopimelate decarboxylase [Bacteroidales bacterium]
MRDLSAYKNAFCTLETPFYFYDTELLSRTIEEVLRASGKYGIDVHYAVKANVEERLLRMISSAGLGADAVSGNEVSRAVECGFPKNKVVFAGVGKTDREIRAALGIEAFNVESLQELEVIDSIAAAAGITADVSLRINPGVDAHTHKFITTGLEANKFGLVPEEFQPAADAFKRLRNVRFTGLHFHVGSQITDIQEV